MEFLHAIGTHARKTGLKAKEDVRRDDHDMEDIDDFFKETTIIQHPNITDRSRRKSSRRSTKAGDLHTVLPLDISQPQQQQQQPLSSRIPLTKTQPSIPVRDNSQKRLISPPALLTGDQISTYRKGLASPMPIDNAYAQNSDLDDNNNNYADDQDMGFDDFQADFQEDFQPEFDPVPIEDQPIQQTQEDQFKQGLSMSPVRLSQVRTNKAQRLFVDESDLDKNITMRSRSRRTTASNSRISTPGPTPSNSAGGAGGSRGGRGGHSVAGTGGRVMVTSPLNSIRARLESPMRIPLSSKSQPVTRTTTARTTSMKKGAMSSLSKNIALGKNKATFKARPKAKTLSSQSGAGTLPSTPPTKVNSGSEDEESGQENQYTTSRHQPQQGVSPPVNEYSDEDNEESEHANASYESDVSLYDAHANATQNQNDSDEEDEDEDEQSAVPDESIDSPADEEEGSDDMEMSMRGRPRERSTIIEESEEGDEEQTQDTTIPSPPPSSRSKSNRQQHSKPLSLSRATSRSREQPLQEHHISLKKLARLQREKSDLEEKRNPQLEESQPTRRSKRIRMAPLAFWRNERAVYQKKEGDLVPTIKEIITVDEPKPVKLNNSRVNSRVSSRVNSRRPSRVRSKIGSRIGSRVASPVRSNKRSKSNLAEAILEEDDDEDEDMEENRDVQLWNQIKSGKLKGSEWIHSSSNLTLPTYTQHGSDLKTDRLIAWSSNQISVNQTKHIRNSTDNFHLSILFDANREYTATGIMHFPSKSQGGRKGMRSTEQTCFVFYCIKGILQVSLSGNVFVISKGCALEVPMGNFYGFDNIGEEVCSMFFVQTRGIINEGAAEGQDGSGDDSEL